MKTTLAAIAAFGLAASATPALADDVTSVTVSYEDINLETAAGQERLDRRIESAARTVCGYERHRAGTRIVSSKVRTCMEKATASARANVAALTLAQTRGG